MRKILMAIPYLNSGGVEVSLIRFLKEFVKDKENDITLLMLKMEGMYLESVPDEIKIVELTYDNDMYSYDHKIKDIKEIKGIRNKIKFLKYRLLLRKFLANNDWENYYKEILKHVNSLDGDYDLAIDWHGYGHFITTVVAEKVNARKKAFWIHDEKNKWLDKVDYWFDAFDKIYCVGVACKNMALKNKPCLKDKLNIFYNMTDYVNVREKSLEKIELPYEKDKFNIITIGRIEWQKAYDIAVLTAKRLKDMGFNFCWYAIGDGHKRAEIEKLIKDNDLDDCFKLLGIRKNPFPYVRKADAFVLTSRHEGYCLATLEAKILGKIIIATDIESNREQITSYENGILCKLDAEDFASKIMELANDKSLKNKIENNLKNENFDYTDEFQKLYKLMGE